MTRTTFELLQCGAVAELYCASAERGIASSRSAHRAAGGGVVAFERCETRITTPARGTSAVAPGGGRGGRGKSFRAVSIISPAGIKRRRWARRITPMVLAASHFRRGRNGTLRANANIFLSA